ncbi:MAG: class IV adenylate cyclase [Conexivisphaerales archaeon]
MEREVKLRVKDRALLLERLSKLGAKLVSHREQQDYYLDNGSLHSRGESLRVRHDGDKCYLTFKGKLINDELKLREELEVSMGNCSAALEIMGHLGFVKKITVKKVRESYMLKDIIIEVDQVDELGDFIEVELRNEMQVKEIKELADKLVVEWIPIKVGYADMLLELRKP